MVSGVKRTQRDYLLSFKLGVVDQVQKGELSYKQAQQRYGIQGRSTVLVWVRKHGLAGAVPASACFQGKAMTRKTETTLTPDQRIKQLEVQLREATEKARLFEAVLDVLKKDYGVSVVKKPLGKSSRKSGFLA